MGPKEIMLVSYSVHPAHGSRALTGIKCDIHGPWRWISIDVGDLLTFLVAPPSVQNVDLHKTISGKISAEFLFNLLGFVMAFVDKSSSFDDLFSSATTRSKSPLCTILVTLVVSILQVSKQKEKQF